MTWSPVRQAGTDKRDQYIAVARYFTREICHENRPWSPTTRREPQTSQSNFALLEGPDVALPLRLYCWAAVGVPTCRISRPSLNRRLRCCQRIDLSNVPPWPQPPKLVCSVIHWTSAPHTAGESKGPANSS